MKKLIIFLSIITVIITTSCTKTIVCIEDDGEIIELKDSHKVTKSGDTVIVENTLYHTNLYGIYKGKLPENMIDTNVFIYYTKAVVIK